MTLKFKKIFHWLLVLLWMALIFYLSSQPAVESSELSTGITEIIIKFLKEIVPSIDIDLEMFGHIIRKSAHFFAYLVLGVLVINGLRSSQVMGVKALATAMAICVLYAISDEVHQLFVPGRAGQIKDVLIDSAGAVVGVIGALSLRLDKGINRIVKRR